MEMLLTGESIDAPTALAYGLVNRVVPAAELDAAVAHFTVIILAGSPAVVRGGKAAFHRQIERPLEAAYEETGGRWPRTSRSKTPLKALTPSSASAPLGRSLNRLFRA